MQTWKIRNQVYTHPQLMELKRQGLDPRKDDIVMKFVTVDKSGKVVRKKEEEVKGEPTPNKDVELFKEFESLKKEKAWLKPDKKARYSELKALLK